MLENQARVVKKSFFQLRYKYLIYFAVFFNVLFPKGGFKFGGIPITWGYLFLGFLTCLCIFDFLVNSNKKMDSNRFLIIAYSLPLQILLLTFMPTMEHFAVGMSISTVISLVFIPWMLLVFIGCYIDQIDLGYLLEQMRRAIYFLAVFGIFLFLFRAVTGKMLEIPFLIVNWGDYGQLEETKNLNRGILQKLISTYNNGNLFGVCMLIFLPLYGYLEKTKRKIFIVKLALVLTLSRTVWIGLVINEAIKYLYIYKLSFNRILKLLTVLLVITFSLIYLSFKIDYRGIGFLFDPTLGGRQNQFRWLLDEKIYILPGPEFHAIYEIVYLGFLKYFGVSGLVAYCVAAFSPVFFHFKKKFRFASTPYKKSLASGLIIYLIVSCSDGALNYIPIMAFFWYNVSLLVSRNPTFLNHSYFVKK